MRPVPFRLRAFFLCLIAWTVLSVACGGGGGGDGSGGGGTDDAGGNTEASASDTGAVSDDGGVAADTSTTDTSVDDGSAAADADDATTDADANDDTGDASSDVSDAAPDVLPDALPSPDGSSNLLPVVVITGPENNTFAAAPATFNIAATANDVDGTVTKVELFSGATLLATFATGSVSYDWKNVPAGTYTITAVATDDQGGKQTSAPITLVVDAPPTVSLTSPSAGFLGTAATSTILTADADDSDGSVVAVDFYEGTNLLGTATSAPYTLPWNVLLPGSYTLTAKATDDQGVTTTSAPVTVLVNAAPTVVLTSPAAGTVSVAPGSFAIAATAADTDGTITKVELFAGLKLLATKNAPPYTFNWTNVPAGTYAITARATDNRGAIAVSTPVTVYSNLAPTVSITAPTNGTVVVSPGPLTITAQGADTDGSVATIDLYSDSTLLGSFVGGNVSFDATGLVSGTYKLTAVATDNHGTATTSAPITITVNDAPTVAITAPSAGLVGNAPYSTTITANAADSDGTIASVAFYSGATLLGTDFAAPYTFAWNAVPAGTYVLKAVAKDNLGATTTSSTVTVTVNAPPTVSLTAPSAGSLGTAPASTTITANAADADGTVAQVAFYAGATLLGTDSTAPYSFAWNNIAAGTYVLKAVATDNDGATTNSSTVTVTVNAAPTVTITAPAAGLLGTAPYSTTISATAADSDGTIAQVQFYDGATLIGTDLTSPYAVAWNNVAAGSHNLTAVAKDNSGATTTSSTVTVTINAAPTVSITAPTAGTYGPAPYSTTITATASDPDGTINKVDFYVDGVLLGTDSVGPTYGFAWNNAAAGAHALTAKATDNSGAVTTSSAVNVTVNAAPSVTITSPAQSAVIGTAPYSTSITATASDSDGTVSKVDFYVDGAFLATDGTAPYSVAWNSIPAGSHALVAKATDNNGAVTTSSTITVTVNAAPSVSVTAPTAGVVGTAPYSTTITASATDSDGTISKVDFYVDGVLLGTDSVGPTYGFAWNNAAAGGYTLTAKATDNNGAVTTSAAVVVTVNAAPTVSITAPSNNASFTAGLDVPITANAADSDGAVVKVEFYADGALIGTDLTAPYAFTWLAVPAGTYALTAKATDDNGGTTTSAIVNINVSPP